MPRSASTPLKLGVLGVFFAGILSSGGYDLVRYLRDGPPPFALLPEIREGLAVARFHDGEFTRKFELLLGRASLAAAEIRPRYGAWLIGSLHATPVMSSYGREGMMFATRPPGYRTEPADEVARQIAAKVAAVARRFAERGVALVYCPVALKGVVCADLAPPSARGRPELYAALHAAVERLGVPAVDTLRVLRDARAAGVRVFPDHDGHWTFAGAQAAAEEAARVAGARVDPASRKSRLVPKGTVPDVGSEFATSGILISHVLGSDFVRTRLEVEGPLRELPLFSLFDEHGAAFPVDAFAKDAGAVVAGTSYSVDHELSSPGFGALFAHAIDRPTRVLAMRGAGPTAPLWGAIQIGAAAGYPPILLWEMPGIDLFDTDSPLPNLGLFFTTCLPLKPCHLFDADPLMTDRTSGASFRGIHRLRDSGLRFAAPPGRVAHDGRGAVTLELTGEVVRGDVYVEIDGGGSHEATRWKPGSPSVWLPILSRRPTDVCTITLYADDAEIRLDRARLYGDFARDAGPAATLAKPALTPDGFAAAADFPTPVAAGLRDVVEIRLRTAAQGGVAHDDVEIEMRNADGFARYEFPRLEPGALLILDPAALPPSTDSASAESRPDGHAEKLARRAPIATVRLTAAGPAPARSPFASVTVRPKTM